MTNRRAHYYGNKAAEPIMPRERPVTVTGADEIVDVLGIGSKQVYRLYEAYKDLPDGPPIHQIRSRLGNR